jgi:phosphohistidine phosphatase
VGRYIAGAPVDGVPVPELVLCSSARRAVQTAELVVLELGAGVELMVERALYRADADDVIDRLRELGDDVASVMVVGHNPTLEHLALVLLQPEDAAGRSRLEQGFPTAALAVVGVPATSWRALSNGTGRLLDLRAPGR